MKIASWNVNSLRARFERVKEFLELNDDIDVLLLQETKCQDKNFPEFDIRILGYDVAHYGLSQYNGVCIISKEDLIDVKIGLNTTEDPYINDGRIISATVNGITIVSVYCPNGRDIDSEHYEMKLKWFDLLKEELQKLLIENEKVIVMGDFNIVPTDADVYDISKITMTTHVTKKEREKLSAILELGFIDSYRCLYPKGEGFTYWDYRNGDFNNNRGLRIDLGLISNTLVNRLKDVSVSRESRIGDSPSDHACIILECDSSYTKT